MKNFKLLFGILISTIVLSCSSDNSGNDDNDITFDPSHLIGKWEPFQFNTFMGSLEEGWNEYGEVGDWDEFFFCNGVVNFYDEYLSNNTLINNTPRYYSGCEEIITVGVWELNGNDIEINISDIPFIGMPTTRRIIQLNQTYLKTVENDPNNNGKVRVFGWKRKMD